MSYQWNWSVFGQETVVGDGATYADWMLAGLKMTVMVSLSSWVLALLLGAVVGVLRTVPNKGLRAVATAYVELLRNIPLLVQLFVWYFIVPELLPTAWGTAIKQLPPDLQQFGAAVICLGLFTSARVSEQVRAGIESLPIGQTRAGPGPEPAASLPAGAAAHGLSAHRAAADLGVPQHLQELGRVLDHRPAGAGRARQAAGGLHRAALRVLHRRDGDVPAHQRRRDDADGLAGAPRQGARLHGPVNEKEHKHGLRIRLVLHPGLAALPGRRHAGLAGDHGGGAGGGHGVGHGAGADAAVARGAAALVRHRLHQPVPLGAAGDGAAVVLPDRAAAVHSAVQPLADHRPAPDLGHGGFCAVRVGLLRRDHPRRHPVGAQGPAGRGHRTGP